MGLIKFTELEKKKKKEGGGVWVSPMDGWSVTRKQICKMACVCRILSDMNNKCCKVTGSGHPISEPVALVCTIRTYSSVFYYKQSATRKASFL
jgi:hypothetical protein